MDQNLKSRVLFDAIGLPAKFTYFLTTNFNHTSIKMTPNIHLSGVIFHATATVERFYLHQSRILSRKKIKELVERLGGFSYSEKFL